MSLNMFEIGGFFKRFVVVIQILHPPMKTCKQKWIVSEEQSTHL